MTHSMMAEPIRALELHYPMIQFLKFILGCEAWENKRKEIILGLTNE